MGIEDLFNPDESYLEGLVGGDDFYDRYPGAAVTMPPDFMDPEDPGQDPFSAFPTVEEQILSGTEPMLPPEPVMPDPNEPGPYPDLEELAAEVAAIPEHPFDEIIPRGDTSMVETSQTGSPVVGDPLEKAEPTAWESKRFDYGVIPRSLNVFGGENKEVAQRLGRFSSMPSLHQPESVETGDPGGFPGTGTMSQEEVRVLSHFRSLDLALADAAPDSEGWESIRSERDALKDEAYEIYNRVTGENAEAAELGITPEEHKENKLKEEAQAMLPDVPWQITAPGRIVGAGVSSFAAGGQGIILGALDTVGFGTREYANNRKRMADRDRQRRDLRYGVGYGEASWEKSIVEGGAYAVEALIPGVTSFILSGGNPWVTKSVIDGYFALSSANNQYVESIDQGRGEWAATLDGATSGAITYGVMRGGYWVGKKLGVMTPEYMAIPLMSSGGRELARSTVTRSIPQAITDFAFSLTMGAGVEATEEVVEFLGEQVRDEIFDINNGRGNSFTWDNIKAGVTEIAGPSAVAGLAGGALQHSRNLYDGIRVQVDETIKDGPSMFAGVESASRDVAEAVGLDWKPSPEDASPEVKEANKQEFNNLLHKAILDPETRAKTLEVLAGLKDPATSRSGFAEDTGIKRSNAVERKFYRETMKSFREVYGGLGDIQLDSILEGMDPSAASEIDVDDRVEANTVLEKLHEAGHKDLAADLRRDWGLVITPPAPEITTPPPEAEGEVAETTDAPEPAAPPTPTIPTVEELNGLSSPALGKMASDLGLGKLSGHKKAEKIAAIRKALAEQAAEQEVATEKAGIREKRRQQSLPLESKRQELDDIKMLKKRLPKDFKVTRVPFHEDAEEAPLGRRIYRIEDNLSRSRVTIIAGEDTGSWVSRENAIKTMMETKGYTREEAERRRPVGGFILNDGPLEIDGHALAILVDRADRDALSDTEAHEAVHWVSAMQMWSPEEWSGLVDKYSSPEKSRLEQEEDIARSKFWKKETRTPTLRQKFLKYLRKLLGLAKEMTGEDYAAQAEQAFASGQVLRRRGIDIADAIARRKLPYGEQQAENAAAWAEYSAKKSEPPTDTEPPAGPADPDPSPGPTGPAPSGPEGDASPAPDPSPGEAPAAPEPVVAPAEEQTVRARKIPSGAMGFIIDELELAESDGSDRYEGTSHGSTYFEGTPSQMGWMLERLKEDLNDDHEFYIRGNTNRDLTDAQVAFGVRSRVKSLETGIRILQDAIDKAPPAPTSEAGEIPPGVVGHIADLMLTGAPLDAAQQAVYDSNPGMVDAFIERRLEQSKEEETKPSSSIKQQFLFDDAPIDPVSVERATQLAAEADKSLALSEEAFWGEFWPKMLAESGRAFGKDETAPAIEKLMEDMEDFARSNPQFLDYYAQDWEAARAHLDAHYGGISDDQFIFFRAMSGITSPATNLNENARESIALLELFDKDGDLNALETLRSDKNNWKLKKDNPVAFTGPTGPNKAMAARTIANLVNELGSATAAIEHLVEPVTVKELHAFRKNSTAWGSGRVEKIGMIRTAVRNATGQDELIPRMFVFGPKLGPYTLNMVGETNYTTTDVWESRLIRSYFDGMFEENTGIWKGSEEYDFFQEFASEFNKAYNEKTGQTLPASAIQAMRWFYILDAANKSGYKSARTAETYSNYISQRLQERQGSPRPDVADQRGRRSGDVQAGQKGQAAGRQDQDLQLSDEPIDDDVRHDGRVNPGQTSEVESKYKQTSEAQGDPTPDVSQEDLNEFRRQAKERIEADYEGEIARILEMVDAHVAEGKTIGTSLPNEVDIAILRELIHQTGRRTLSAWDFKTNTYSDGGLSDRRFTRLTKIFRSTGEYWSSLGRVRQNDAKDPAISPEEHRSRTLVDAVNTIRVRLQKEAEAAGAPPGAPGEGAGPGDGSGTGTPGEVGATEDTASPEGEPGYPSTPTKKILEGLDRQGFDVGDVDGIARDKKRSLEFLNQLYALEGRPHDAVYEYWRNMLLSGPQTQAVNFAGTSAFMGYMMFFERFMEASLAGGLKLATGGQYAKGREDVATFREIGHAFHGLGDAFWTSLQNARDTWASERSSFDADWGQEDRTKDYFSSRRRKRKRKGEEKGMPTFGPEIAGKKGRIIRALGFRQSAFADDFLKTLGQKIEVNMLAHRIAAARTGKAWGDPDFDALFEEQIADPTSAANLVAVRRTMRGAFQGDEGIAMRYAGDVSLSIHENVVGRYFHPFHKTPLNITDEAIRRAPILGLLADIYSYRTRQQANSETEAEIAAKVADGKMTEEEATAARAKLWEADGMTGILARQVTALAIMTLLYATNDPEDPWVTGGKANWDYKEREAAYATGYAPMTIAIGDTRFSYARAEPMAMILGIMADAHHGWARGEGMFETLTKSVFGQLTEKTFLEGFSDLVNIGRDVVEGGTRKEARKWAVDFTVSWIPNLWRQTARQYGSDLVPETKIWGKDAEALNRMTLRRIGQKSFLDGGFITKRPKYDKWGYEVSKRPRDMGPLSDFGYQVLKYGHVPTKVFATNKANAADLALYRYNARRPSSEQIYLLSPSKRFKHNGENYMLSEEQYSNYQKYVGLMARATINAQKIMDTDNPTDADIERLKRVYSKSATHVRNLLKPQWLDGAPGTITALDGMSTGR